MKILKMINSLDDTWTTYTTLLKYPEEIDNVDTSSLSGWHWTKLIHINSHMADHCDWNTLDETDWSWLLSVKPQFADKYEEYQVLGNLKL